jgi:hypothetical protein
MKPTLKAHGTDRLKLKSDEPLSSFAFKVNLRRYTKARMQSQLTSLRKNPVCAMCGGPAASPEAVHALIHFSAGAYTRPLLSST